MSVLTRPFQHSKQLNTDAPKLFWDQFCFCYDFRYESNGIFVLGVGFFSSDKFRFFN